MSASALDPFDAGLGADGRRHSIIGGVIGVGLATIGGKGVNWGWKGVSTVFAGWVISPAIAGAFAAILFLITKYGVLQRKNPVRAAMFAIPIYFALTSGILTMLIVWKGGESAAIPDLVMCAIR